VSDLSPPSKHIPDNLPDLPSGTRLLQGRVLAGTPSGGDATASLGEAILIPHILTGFLHTGGSTKTGDISRRKGITMHHHLSP
jgi:hypothetical protein